MSPGEKSAGGSDSDRNTRGRVILVGAGPGNPDLITVRGAGALATADVVLFDELASDELLYLAPDRAERINVGKRGHDAPTRSQSEINALIVERALRGGVKSAEDLVALEAELADTSTSTFLRVRHTHRSLVNLLN